MTWQDHVDWNPELVSLNSKFQFLFFFIFLKISEVVDFQIPLLDVAVTWRKSGSVEAENRWKLRTGWAGSSPWVTMTRGTKAFSGFSGASSSQTPIKVSFQLLMRAVV
jgi:hypothetical protein